jgi:hypothetical protein
LVISSASDVSVDTFASSLMELSGSEPIFRMIIGDLPEWKEPQRLPHCKEMTEKMIIL